MHFLYILYSHKVDRYYIGETSEPENRLSLHNSHYFKKAFTKSADDWKIVLSKECESKEDAQYLERFLKRMKSRKFIEKVIAEPRILEDLLSKK